ncbi:50S ribosomal protein L19 [Patescibacteria group bacterium]
MANRAIWKSIDEEDEKTVTFHVGDTVRVHYMLIEKEKVTGKTKREVNVEIRERIQVFEGIVISIKGSGESVMFTVRKIGSQAIGIERIFPLNSPWIKNFEIKKYGMVRRSKLYYLRDRIGKAATKIKEKRPVKKAVEKTSKKKEEKSPKKVEKKNPKKEKVQSPKKDDKKSPKPQAKTG